MVLNFPDGESFTTGSVGYRSRPATERETTNRLMLQVEIEGVKTEAAVDTGGIYFVCTAQIANRLNLDEKDALDEETIKVRESSVTGRLHRIPLIIQAEEGKSIEVEVTALVPSDTREDQWFEQLPCFLGWQGCLERLRFAIDPNTETFFFGSP